MHRTHTHTHSSMPTTIEMLQAIRTTCDRYLQASLIDQIRHMDARLVEILWINRDRFKYLLCNANDLVAMLLRLNATNMTAFFNQAQFDLAYMEAMRRTFDTIYRVQYPPVVAVHTHTASPFGAFHSHFHHQQHPYAPASAAPYQPPYAMSPSRAPQSHFHQPSPGPQGRGHVQAQPQPHQPGGFGHAPGHGHGHH